MRKEDKANFLFEELGNVDDDYLLESSGRPLAAIALKQKKRKRARVLGILLAASISFTLLMLTVNYRAQHVDEPPTTPEPTTATILPEEQKLPPEMERQVLFGSTPGIILEEEDGERYFYAICEQDFTSLLRLAADDTDRPAAGASGEKVWFTDGRGRVICPYLRYTRGNIGYGALFSYEEEIGLSRELKNELRRLTGGALA